MKQVKLKTTEQKLISAALNELEKNSFSSINFRDLASKAKVSHMTAYRAFKTKEELFEKIAIEGFQILDEMITEAINKNPTDPEKQMLNTCFAYLSFSNDYPHHLLCMFDRREFKGVYSDPEFPKMSQRPFKNFMIIVNNCKMKGLLPEKKNTEEMAIVIWSAIHGYLQLNNKADLKIAVNKVPDPKKLIKVILETIMLGLNH